MMEKMIFETSSKKFLSCLKYGCNSFGRVNTNCRCGRFRSTFSERCLREKKESFLITTGAKIPVLASYFERSDERV
jgi:hypothetical protein